MFDLNNKKGKLCFEEVGFLFAFIFIFVQLFLRYTYLESKRTLHSRRKLQKKTFKENKFRFSINT